MKTILLFDFTADNENNTISIKREFAAGAGLVWDVWTKPEHIDQCEALNPCHSETKSMDFREGGFRLYAMISPEGKKLWGRIDFQKIDSKKSYTASKAFCDENGNVNPETPRSLWKHVFSERAGITTVNVHIQYENAAHLEMMIKGGFKEGVAAGLQNLDKLLLILKNKNNE